MNIITNIFEACSLFLLFESFLSRREKIPNILYCAGVIILTLLLFLCNIEYMGFANNVAMVLAGVLVAMMYYKGSLKFIVLISIVGNMLTLSLEIIVLYGITFVYHLTVEDVVNIPEYQLLGIVLSKISLIAVAYAIYQYKKRKTYKMTQAYWFLFLGLFSISLFTAFVLYKLSYEVVSTDYNGITLLCTIGLFACMFFSLYLYDRQERQAHAIRLQAQAELHLQEQLKHMDELMIQQEQLRRFRHDISNQLIALKSYLTTQVTEKEGLHHLEYLTNALMDTDKVVDTGNPALDAIISAKQAVAAQKGIDFHYQLQIPKQLPIAPEDICVIFGNALDNAIEACEHVTQGSKEISLTLIKQNGIILCKLVNTASTKPKKFWETSKGDAVNHGYGISQIKQSLEKYDCTPSFSWEDGQVVFRFNLFTE